ncbi:hypothetical protein EGW08_019132 [Elysia chlorotica]|uniref:Uncharacterized protein n=1 Tax=Elysia chlorotica TaxID=188477 RepID=A0A3S1B697_ELYCH|nr:hypothetical protein EGW08_019132 [Elysia chlorotica]
MHGNRPHFLLEAVQVPFELSPISFVCSEYVDSLTLPAASYSQIPGVSLGGGCLRNKTPRHPSPVHVSEHPSPTQRDSDIVGEDGPAADPSTTRITTSRHPSADQQPSTGTPVTTNTAGTSTCTSINITAPHINKPSSSSSDHDATTTKHTHPLVTVTSHTYPHATTTTPTHSRSPTPARRTRPNRRFIKHDKYQLLKQQRSSINEHTVINLSSHTLTSTQTQLLSKNLNFCPTPKTINNIELSRDIFRFTRRLRLAEFFWDEENDEPNTTTCDTDTASPPFLLRHVSTVVNPGDNADGSFDNGNKDSSYTEVLKTTVHTGSNRNTPNDKDTRLVVDRQSAGGVKMLRPAVTDLLVMVTNELHTDPGAESHRCRPRLNTAPGGGTSHPSDTDPSPTWRVTAPNVTALGPGNEYVQGDVL